MIKFRGLPAQRCQKIPARGPTTSGDATLATISARGR